MTGPSPWFISETCTSSLTHIFSYSFILTYSLCHDSQLILLFKIFLKSLYLHISTVITLVQNLICSYSTYYSSLFFFFFTLLTIVVFWLSISTCNPFNLHAPLSSIWSFLISQWHLSKFTYPAFVPCIPVHATQNDLFDPSLSCCFTCFFLSLEGPPNHSSKLVSLSLGISSLLESSRLLGGPP